MPPTAMTPLIRLLLGVWMSAAPPIHKGADTAGWTSNADGGHPPSVAPATMGDEAAVRFTYVHQLPGWGNAAHAVTVPPSAYAIRLRLYSIAAQPGAMMHVWLFEPDGDAWVGRVRDGDRDLGQWTVGWHVLELPLERMAFEPRGNRTRQLTTANKVLVGFNGADSDVAIAAMEWLTASQPAAATQPSDTTPPAVKPGRKATIALFADSRFGAVHDAKCSPSDPAYLASILERSGYGTAMLTAEHLADPAVFTPKRFALLVLPYGPNYPAAAEPAIRDYLMHGGCFFSTGGYAFDRPSYVGPGGDLTAATSGRAVTAAQLEKSEAFYSFNTRYGHPGDTMTTRPEQIGAFDPAFELERVARVVAGDDQFIAPAGFDWALPIKGYAARSMIAKNSPVFPDLHARTIPLLEARDALGRPRGPVGSVAYLFDGPYRGSAWGFVGVTSHDVFAATSPKAAEMAELFVKTIDALLARCFLYDLRSDLACYQDERRVTLSVRVANYGPEPIDATVRLAIGPGAGTPVAVRLAAGEAQPVELAVDRPAHEDEPQEFTAELLIDNRVIDRMRSAYVVSRPASSGSSLDLRFADNYFRWAGRPTFITGTNITGEIFYSLDEGPLTWNRDFAGMADAGLRLVRILHFSPFAYRGYQGEVGHDAMHLATRPPERLIRQMDAIVQLARKHGVVIFLTLHDWLPIALTDAELQAQKTWNRFWVYRYKDTPGIVYDIQNEPNAAPGSEPVVPKLWEAFLTERYGSLDAAWKAWARPGARPEPIPTQLPRAQSGWQDLNARDWGRFKHALLERWLRANADGIREGDADALFTIGLLQTPGAGDPAIAARAVRFSNCHFYGNIHDLAAQLKFIDRRAYGKGLSLGEFGSIPMHDQRVYGHDGTMPQESIGHFLNVGHYALGLGAGFICNWSFKDFAGAIFPWGIRHVGQGRPVPKDVLLAYRNFALLARQVEPVYRAPELALLLPDGNRFGAHAGDMQNALYASISTLIRLGVPFNVLNEEDLATAEMPTKVLLWPCPYAVDDNTFARVLAFMKNGGHLYVSGSVGFSADRQPTRRDRAAALGLPDMDMTPPWTREPVTTRPATARSIAENGRVCYVPWPAEIASPKDLTQLYRSFLDAVPVRRCDVEPDDAAESIFRLPTRQGEALIIVRRQDTEKTFTATLGGLSLRLDARGKAPAFVWVEGNQLRAASLKGTLAIAGPDRRYEDIVRADGLAAVVAIPKDGHSTDLRTAETRLVLPFEAGRVSIACGAASKPYSLQLGDLNTLRWQALRTDPAPVARSRIDVIIDADTYLDMRLICPADKLDAAVAAVNQWLGR